MVEYNDLIFEISRSGRVGYSLPKSDVESVDLRRLSMWQSYVPDVLTYMQWGAS